MASLNDLLSAALDVIDILKDIDEFSNARIAVIGGMAPGKGDLFGRTTNDVDFMISLDNAPKGVKSKLLSLPNSPFSSPADTSFYNIPGGRSMQIDITPEKQGPYMPAAAETIKYIPAQHLPYISPTDLLVFKIYSCGLRGIVAKRRADASDAETIIENNIFTMPISLTDKQMEIVEGGLEDVVLIGSKTENWWRQRLGVLKHKQPSEPWVAS